MAYNVRQLQDLQNKISIEPDMPNAMDRYTAMKLLQRKPVRRPIRRDQGGELQQNANELASKGRYGDTMLMHVTPEEVRGLSSIAPVTINPETGLPEAFAWLPMVLAGAAIGGVGSAATGGDPLKGALLGAVGGFMPTALGGLAGATGLGSLWTGLGPIGQGMLSGAAMGGVRSLFGDSDNPLRDILIGGTMGGVGGAMFPGTVEASGLEGMEYGTSIREGVTDMIPSVQDFNSGVPSAMPMPGASYATRNMPVDAGQVSSQATRQLSPSLNVVQGQFGPLVTRPTSMGYNQAIIPRSDILSGGEGFYGSSGGEELDRLQSQSPVRDFGWEGYRTGPTTTTSKYEAPYPKFGDVDANKAISTTASYGDKIKHWWGERKPWEQAAMIGGTGLLGLSALEEQQPQAALAQARPPSAIPFTPAKPFRVPIRDRDEEFYVRTIGEGRTPEETEYFTEDVNVAKEGGIVSLNIGGAPTGGGPGGRASTGHYGEVGPIGVNTYNPYTTHYTSTPDRRGEGGYETPVVSPFEFPEVSPFRSNLPAFNIEDRLETINAPAFEPVSSIPISSLSPTGLGTLQQIALSNAANVAQQFIDPTVETAISTPSVNPEEQAIIDQFTGQEGGIIGLANGGSIPAFGTNTPVFEGRVQGHGDGMADQVSFGVVPQTPEDIPNTPDMALLSSDEYVIPADVVSMLGNGSSTAGSKMLDQFNKTMRMKAHGTNRQQRELDAGKELSSLV
jgi:hypothetical protein